MITDTLVNVDPAVGAKEIFTTLKTAAPGEVLRGVAFAPKTGTSQMLNVPLVLSAAAPGVIGLAPGSIASANGQNLAAGVTEDVLGPAPTTWFGTSVTIIDSNGKSSAAPLIFVSPWQVNFIVPSGVALGNAQVMITSPLGIQAANVPISTVVPALFTLNGSGLAVAYAYRFSGAAQTYEPAFALNSLGTYTASPIAMGAAGDQVYLSLFGTGLQAAGTSAVTATVNGVAAQVVYAGPQPSYPGLDQVNLLLPASLAGKGNVNIQLTANKVAANLVQITIQ